MVSAGAVAVGAVVVAAVVQLQRFLGLEMFVVCRMWCCFLLVFFRCFLGIYPVLLAFLACLSIKGPLEFLFLLKFFLADPSSDSLHFFRLWHVMLFLVLSVLCSWWRSLIGFQRNVFGSQGPQFDPGLA